MGEIRGEGCSEFWRDGHREGELYQASTPRSDEKAARPVHRGGRGSQRSENQRLGDVDLVLRVEPRHGKCETQHVDATTSTTLLSCFFCAEDMKPVKFVLRISEERQHIHTRTSNFKFRSSARVCAFTTRTVPTPRPPFLPLPPFPGCCHLHVSPPTVQRRKEPDVR